MTAPAAPHPILTTLPLPQNNGRIVVDQTTEVPGWSQVWAIGDCAEIKQADGKISPATADHAMRQAKTCAQNIVASCRGTSKSRFRFTELGRLGSLGRRSAVAEILGFRFTGIFAWLLWRGAYVAKFPGLDGQLRVIADGILDAFLPCNITQLRIFHEEAVHREHFEAGETVFASGDFGDKVYFIVQGEAEVERSGERVAKLHPGDIFGEAALISNQPRNATIRVSSQLDTVAVSRNAFQQLLMHLPGLGNTMQELMSDRIKVGEDLKELVRKANSPVHDFSLTGRPR